MPPKEPHVAETCHGGVLVGQGRDPVLSLGRGGWRALFGIVHEDVDLG
jgi:hypothetical protein